MANLINRQKVLSINILNYNTFEKSRVCIDSCLKQKGDNFRVLLIDNSSTDDSYIKLKEIYGNQIEYFQTGENFGFAKGNNIGVKDSFDKGYQYTLMLNSDTEIVGEELVSNLIDIISSNEKCKVIVPDIFHVTVNGNRLHKNDSFYLRMLRRINILPSNHKINEDIQTISEAHGSALLVENMEFLKVGGFPWYFFMYGEEGLFSKRILWDGYLIFSWSNKKCYILHHHDKSKRIDPWRLFLMGRNRVLEFYSVDEAKQTFLWKFCLFFFYLKICLSSNKDMRIHFCKGMKNGFNMVRCNASKESFYNNGRLIRSNY